MTRSRRVPQKRAGVRIRTLGLPALMGAVMIVRGQTAPSPATQAKQTASNLSADAAEPLGKKAWHILRDAAANSLLLLHDDVGYDPYYEVLTGKKRPGKGLIKEQLDTLKDKKKVAQMGFEEGIGFIPFGGIGYEIFKTVTKNDLAPVRAAAAKKLAQDPEPDAGEALVKASGDKDWKVRAAALDAIALREDASLVPRIVPAMDDKNDVVRFTAAACVAHLSSLPKKPEAVGAARQLRED